MVFSAIIFGLFALAPVLGYMNWSTVGSNQQTLVFVVLFIWTLRVAAAGFVVSAVMASVAPVPATFLYSIVGLLAGVGLLIVGVLDFLDKAHMLFTMSEILLIVFGGWNLFSSATALRAVMGSGSGEE